MSPIFWIRKTIHSRREVLVPPSQLPLAKRALEIATLEIGNGEEIYNNAGKHVARYKGRRNWNVGENLGAWCGSFASWAFMQAGLHPADLGVSQRKWDRKRHGARALFKMIGNAGSFPALPEAGDIGLEDRGQEGSWQAHVWFVEHLESLRWVHLIEGNKGKFPSTVSRRRLDLFNPRRLIGFARL